MGRFWQFENLNSSETREKVNRLIYKTVPGLWGHEKRPQISWYSTMQIRAAAGKKLPLIEQTPICRLAGRTHFETFFRTASLQNLNCNPARVNFSKNFFERFARPRRFAPRPRSALKKFPVTKSTIKTKLSKHRFRDFHILSIFKMTLLNFTIF